MVRIIRIICFVILFLILFSVTLFAQTTKAEDKPKPRRHFVTFFVDRINTSPLHFKEHPLQELTGTEINNVYEPGPEVYRSKDKTITITDIGFRSKNKGAGLMVYPFGSSGRGSNLVVQASY